MSFVSRLTFENRRECPSCRDQLFFFLGRDFENQDFSIEIYLCRDIYRDCRDKSRLSRQIEIIETFRDLSRFLEIFTNRQLWKVTSFHRCLLVKWIKSSNLD
jgi:hypothetical protein